MQEPDNLPFFSLPVVLAPERSEDVVTNPPSPTKQKSTAFAVLFCLVEKGRTRPPMQRRFGQIQTNEVLEKFTNVWYNEYAV